MKKYFLELVEMSILALYWSLHGSPPCAKQSLHCSHLCAEQICRLCSVHGRKQCRLCSAHGWEPCKLCSSRGAETYFQVQKIAKMANLANFQKNLIRTTCILEVYMTYLTTFENEIFWREGILKQTL